MKAKIIEIFSDIFNAGMDAQEVGMPSFDQLQQTGWFNSKIDDIESLYQPQIDKLKEIIKNQDELIEVKEQKCEILADNNNTQVIKMIGLVRLNDELQFRIEQFKNEAGL